MLPDHVQGTSPSLHVCTCVWRELHPMNCESPTSLASKEGSMEDRRSLPRAEGKWNLSSSSPPFIDFLYTSLCYETGFNLLIVQIRKLKLKELTEFSRGQKIVKMESERLISKVQSCGHSLEKLNSCEPCGTIRHFTSRHYLD